MFSSKRDLGLCSRSVKRRVASTAIQLESLEPRTLLASGGASSPGSVFVVVTQGGTAGTSAELRSVTTSTISTENQRALLLAFQNLINDLRTAATEGASENVVRAINADLADIGRIVAVPSSPAVQNLSGDVRAIVASGTFSDNQQQRIANDFSLLFGGGFLSVSPDNSDQGLTTRTLTKPPITGNGNLLADLTDGNGRSANNQGRTRGQGAGDDTPPGIDTHPLDDTQTPETNRREAWSKLLADLQTLTARSTAVPAASSQALSADLAAALRVAGRPSTESISRLRGSLEIGGPLNETRRAELASGLAAALKDAHVSGSLASRIAGEMKSMLAAPDLQPNDAAALMNDILSLLTAGQRPILPGHGKR